MDERHLYAESYLHDSLAIRLGGRAAEVLVLGRGLDGSGQRPGGGDRPGHQDGAGMGTLGAARAPSATDPRARSTSGGSPLGQGRPYAEATQRAIDEEVSRLLLEAEERARALLTENRAALEGVVGVLLEKETISGQELTDAVRAARERTPDAAPRPAMSNEACHPSR